MKHPIAKTLILAGLLGLCGCGTPDETTSFDTFEGTNEFQISVVPIETLPSAYLGTELPNAEFIENLDAYYDTSYSYQALADALSESEYFEYIHLMETAGWEITYNDGSMLYAQKDDGYYRADVKRCKSDDGKAFFNVWIYEN